MKYFDKYQRIITIIGIASFVLSIVFMIWNSATAKTIYDETGAIASIEYEVVPQNLYSIFVFLNIFCFAWFIARSITFKMRQKEEDNEVKEY